MTKDKIVEVNCSPTINNILCEALKNYASTYSSDNSNHYYYIKKSQLLSIIDNIEQQLSQSPSSFSINDDTKYCLEKAVCYHYEHIQQKLRAHSVEQQKHLLLDALHGIPVDDQQLDDALRRDNII